MALGSNRDYVKTHKTTMKRLTEKYPVKQWKCTKCGRINYYNRYKVCPRCQHPRPNDLMV